MARRILSHKVDVTGLTDGQYKIIRGKFNRAIGDIEILVGRALETNEKLKRAETKAAKQKAFHDQVARRKELDEAGRTIRRQASATGFSPEAVKAKVEKEKEQKEALEKYEQEERENYERLKQEAEQNKKDHPELYDKNGKLIDDNSEYSSPNAFIEESDASD